MKPFLPYKSILILLLNKVFRLISYISIEAYVLKQSLQDRILHAKGFLYDTLNRFLIGIRERG